MVETIGTFSFRMVSICGITPFSDELVHSTTTSGFARADCLPGVGVDLHFQPAIEAGHFSQVLSDLGRIDVHGADDLEALAPGDLPDDGGADRSEAKVHDFDGARL